MLQLREDLVYDVGTNNGDDAAYYLHKGYRVLAVEADPSLMDALNSRFGAELASGQLQIANVALAPSRRMAKFYICEGYSLWNSFDRETASRMGRATRAVDVECWPLRDLLLKYGVPHYLKLSLHGEEHFCLADLTPGALPKYISLELPRNQQDSEQVFSRLIALGYADAKIIDQTNQRQFVASERTVANLLRDVIDRYPRVQAAVAAGRRLLAPGRAPQPGATEEKVQGAAGSEWNFPEGSSGPFGEETHGDWRPIAEAQIDWNLFLTTQTARRPEDLSIWHDLHAALPDSPRNGGGKR